MVSSSLDKIGFGGTPTFLRIILQVAIATMHCHMAQPALFSRNIFSHLGGTRVHSGTHEKLSRGAR